MDRLQSLPNSSLWDKYKAAMDDLCADPSLANSRIVDRLEEEVMRRMREAGGKRVEYRGVTV